MRSVSVTVFILWILVQVSALRVPILSIKGFERSRAQSLFESVSASDSVKGGEVSVPENLVALRNKCYLDVTIGVAKGALFARKQLTPALPLIRSIEELKQKTLVLIKAEQQARNLEGYTQLERFLVTFISLLAIFQRGIAKRRTRMATFVKEMLWEARKSFTWFVHIIGSSAKPIVSGTAGLFVLFRDDWTPLYFILAALCNAALSKVMKKALKQPRPEGSPKGGYGMPSSHAQTLFYFFACLTSRLLGLSQLPAATDHFGLVAASSRSINSESVLPSVVLVGLTLLDELFLKLQTLPLVSTTPSLLEAAISVRREVPSAMHRAAFLASTAASALFSSPHFARIAPLVLAFYAVSASSWRVVTRLHSVKQTLVGAALGGTLGYMAHTRQPQVMEAFYRQVLVPFFGYAAPLDAKAFMPAPVPVPLKLKVCTLLVGFALLYSKEIKRWAKRTVASRRTAVIKTPAGIVRQKKYD